MSEGDLYILRLPRLAGAQHFEKCRHSPERNKKRREQLCFKTLDPEKSCHFLRPYLDAQWSFFTYVLQLVESTSPGTENEEENSITGGKTLLRDIVARAEAPKIHIR